MAVFKSFWFVFFLLDKKMAFRKRVVANIAYKDRIFLTPHSDFLKTRALSWNFLITLSCQKPSKISSNPELNELESLPIKIRANFFFCHSSFCCLLNFHTTERARNSFPVSPFKSACVICANSYGKLWQGATYTRSFFNCLYIICVTFRHALISLSIG